MDEREPDERHSDQARGKEQPEGSQNVADEAHARQSNTAQPKGSADTC